MFLFLHGAREDDREKQGRERVVCVTLERVREMLASQLENGRWSGCLKRALFSSSVVLESRGAAGCG